MTENDSNKLTRRLTWYGVGFGAIIAIGTAYLGAGIGVIATVYTILPTLTGNEAIKSVQVLNSLSGVMIENFLMGGSIIGLGVSLAYLAINKSKKIMNHVPSDPNTKSRRPSLQNIILIILGVIGTIVAVQQTLILSEQFALEQFKPEIVPTIENYTFITNDNYLKYPLSEKVSFTSVNPHYLRVEISDLHFTSTGVPPFNKTLASGIDFGRPMIKYIDRGVVNQQFEIPFLLTFNASNLLPYPSNTVLVTLFTSTRIKVVDIQNSDNIIYDQTLTSGIAIPGKYVPKYALPNDTSIVNEQMKKQLNKHIQN